MLFQMTRFRLLLVVGAMLRPASANDIELRLKAGSPLQIRIDEKTPLRAGQPLRGRLVHPIYVFDREVLPAGSLVLGAVSSVKPAPRLERWRAYLQGRLRTRKEAVADFNTIVAPDGRTWKVLTSVTPGIPSVVRVAAGSAKTDSARANGVAQSAKEMVGAAVANNEIVRAARSLRHRVGGSTRAHLGTVARNAARGAGNALRTEFLSYWPFGGQAVRAGTNFTAVMREPLDFGSRFVEAADLAQLGSAPPANSVVRARLLDAINSKTALVGSPVRVAIMRPLISAEGQLILPEGAEILGEVTRAVPARRFGRNGKLQLRFNQVTGAGWAGALSISGSLDAVEANGAAGLRLDEEGGASIPVSKKRLVAPAIAVALSTTAVPDEDSATTMQGGAPGWSGFGLAGTALSLSAPAMAGPLGWWGSASSVYFNLIRRADEVVFPANTVLEIRFGRAPTAVASAAAAGVSGPADGARQLRAR